MADITWDLDSADAYIQSHTLDNEDWFDADDDRKTALLNVAYETLYARFSSYFSDPNFALDDVPDNASYAFAATLAWAYNDTNKMSLEGVSSMSVSGMSITFKDWDRKSLYDLIPDSIYPMIGLPIPSTSGGNRIVPLVM